MRHEVTAILEGNERWPVGFCPEVSGANRPSRAGGSACSIRRNRASGFCGIGQRAALEVSLPKRYGKSLSWLESGLPPFGIRVYVDVF